MTAPSHDDADLAALLARELAGGVRFFWECANDNPASPGYGLVPDTVSLKLVPPNPVASIGSVGFGLSALAIGVERGLLDRSAVIERVRGTLATLKGRLPGTASGPTS